MTFKIMQFLGNTCARMGVIATVFLTLGALAGRLHWFPEILTHFRFQILAGILGVAILSAVMKRWKGLAACGILALPHLVAIGPQILPDEKAVATGPTLKVISYNVLTRNETPEAAIDWILSQDADLVLMTETGHNWDHLLTPLDRHYPHRIHHPRNDNFGLTFYSKLPITAQEVDTQLLPCVYAELDWQGTKLGFVGAHPVPPSNARHAHYRNWTIDRISDYAAKNKGPLIVCGDFNCTPWSPKFSPLSKVLHDTSRGRGYEPTWRRGNLLFGIPIDHLLLDDSLTCTSREIGPSNGSDHSPIIATLARRAP